MHSWVVEDKGPIPIPVTGTDSGTRLRLSRIESEILRGRSPRECRGCLARPANSP